MTTEYLVEGGRFDQTATMAGRANQAATAGACHNFSIEWCSLIAAKQGVEKAAERMAALRVARGGANPILQKVFVRRWNETPRDFHVADTLPINLRGMARRGIGIQYSVYDQATAIRAIKKPGASGMLYSFWFPGRAIGAGDGAHTVAFFRPLTASRGSLIPTSTDVHAFDPNFGEYLIPELELNYWFNKFKASYNGRINYHHLVYISPQNALLSF